MALTAERGQSEASPPALSIAPRLDGGLGTLPADTVLVVLDEQRAALRALGLRAGRRPRLAPPRLPLGSAERSRLLEVAVRVLTEAAIAAEADCRQLLVAAQAEATSIVRQAHDDVAHLTKWLGAGAKEPDLVPAPRPAPRQSKPVERPAPDLSWDAADDEIGAEFFASFASDGTDRWSFLDDDNLVGVGPALVRRLLRRPAGPRQPLADG